MHVRAYRPVSAAQLERIRSELQQLLAGWTTSWGIECTPEVRAVEADAASAAGANADTWRLHWAAGQDAETWCTWSGNMLAELEALVFPSDRTYAVKPDGASIAAAGAKAALDGLVSAVRQWCVAGEAIESLLRPVSLDCLGAGSGSTLVELGLGRSSLRLLLNAACVRSLAGATAAPPLPKLGPARLGAMLDQVPVALTVNAGNAEIGAGSLLSIGIGDVIKLQSPVDGTFPITLPDGTELCTGYIGRSGGMFAVELVKPH